MDPASYHRLRLAVQENALPAGPDYAWELERKLRQELQDCELFDQVEVGHTPDPNQLVIALCRCSPGIMPWTAAQGLERLWGWAVGQSPWEAHCVTSMGEVVDFEGAVTLEDGRHYLTVHLVAERALDGAGTGSTEALATD